MNQARLDDDPFARLAAALPVKPRDQPSRPRPIQMRRSRPSFSDLAPVLPPKFESVPAPPVVQTQPDAPRPAPIPFVPSVIIADDPPVAPTDERARTATARGPRERFRLTGRHSGRGGSLATVLLLLCLSVAIFGIGIAAFVFTKSTKSARTDHAPNHTLVSAHAKR